jgi:hypothetical protein
VLLVACDMPYPEPLHPLRPLPDVFACALLLLPATSANTWPVELSLPSVSTPTRSGSDGLETLRGAIPAARLLPLLEALARNEPADVVIDDEGLAVGVRMAARE